MEFDCAEAMRLVQARLSQYLALEIELDSSRSEREVIEMALFANSFTIAALAVQSVERIERRLWSHQRGESWFETTLPHLGVTNFKACFQVMPCTFRYIVDVCRPTMQRETTNMRTPIIVEKRLCRTIVAKLEESTVAMVRQSELYNHMLEFEAVCGFPSAIGALDGCHLAVSPPKDQDCDYRNYKGWYSIILLAIVDHRYTFRQTLSFSEGYDMDHFSEAVDEPPIENIKQAADPEDLPLYNDGLPAQEDLAVVQPHPALFKQVDDKDTRLREAGAEAVYCLARGAPKGPNIPRAQLNHQGPLFPGHGYATHSQAWVGKPT
ncbi:hypothetical protein HPB47_017798 [Ixodes persulcatus]|uniref:Uncharacterized protein n=1 Tax=Ixodes persulcatus TaxID=34615 RepID=A0AC60QPN6_IXOPE|nr:hypothetical protein HPB47_017798 [Ixodes persulcatus]